MQVDTCDLVEKVFPKFPWRKKAVWRERLCYSSRQTLCLTLCRIDKDTALKFPTCSLWLWLHMCLYLSEYLDSPHLTCSVSAVVLALIVLSRNWTSDLRVSTEDLPGFKYQHWPLKKSQRQGCRDTILGKNPINLEVTKCFFFPQRTKSKSLLYCIVTHKILLSSDKIRTAILNQTMIFGHQLWQERHTKLNLNKCKVATET